MQSFWQMFTTTIGSAAVIAAVVTLFYSSKKRSELHKNNKGLHRIIVMILFGLLSVYASTSAVEVDGALCNCRNLAPLYAGLVAGPVAGIGAGIIGGVFRFAVYGGASAVPCMLACILAGCIGAIGHKFLKQDYGYTLSLGAVLVLITEGVHMLLLCVFGLSDVAAKIAFPIIIANILAMLYCLFIYSRIDRD